MRKRHLNEAAGIVTMILVQIVIWLLMAWVAALAYSGIVDIFSRRHF